MAGLRRKAWPEPASARRSIMILRYLTSPSLGMGVIEHPRPRAGTDLVKPAKMPQPRVFTSLEPSFTMLTVCAVEIGFAER